MTALVTRVPSFTSRRVDLGSALAVALGALLAAVASVNGGYAPTSWGWVALGLAWVAILALVLRPAVSVTAPEAVAVLSFGGLALWTALSAQWSNDAGASMLSLERLLVYAATVAAAAAVLRPDSYRHLLVGVWGGVTLVCGYGALTRLAPDRLHAGGGVAGRRLAAPVGYWNSLGLLGVIGILLAIGLIAWTRSRLLAAAAAAGLVPLALALYFTFSRGAAIVLVPALLVVFACDPRRLRFALVASATMIAPAFAVWEASKQSSLTTLGASTAQTAAAGSHVMRIALVAAVVSGLVGAALVAADGRVDVPRRARTAFAVALAVAVLGVLGALTARYGSPVSIGERAWHSFTAKPATTNGNLNSRLFTLSNNGRIELWKVAWRDFTAHPVLGSGAGTYQSIWLQQRTSGLQVKNAHSLYLETLGELGVVGFLLLLGCLLPPLVGFFRARGEPLVAAAAGAYVAFLVHLLFDWDWQLPGVALAGLLVGAAALPAARDRLSRRTLLLGTRSRVVAGAALLAVAIVAVVGLVGNRAAAAATRAATAEHFAQARAEARRAHRWAPWSSEPWRVLGEAQLLQGDLAAARASFRSGLAENQRSWRLWLDLSLASSGRARRQAAVRALELNPHSTELNGIRDAIGLPASSP